MYKSLAMILSIHGGCVSLACVAGALLMAGGWSVAGISLLIVGLICAQVLLYRALTIRMASSNTKMSSLMTDVTHRLEAQSRAIYAEEAQLRHLQILADMKPGRQVQETEASFIRLADQLASIEQSLPDVLIQTRQHIAGLRDRAAHTHEAVRMLSGREMRL